METMNKKNETGCCPKFNSKPWQDKVFDWKKKRFIKAKVFTFFYIPINFGPVITKLMKKVEEAGAKMPQQLCLSDHTSKWNMDIYLEVEREVPGAENVTLSGKFLSRVYEGNFNETKKWCDDFEDYAKKEGYEIKKWYMWYTTCPKCAKEYGKNYVVILGKVSFTNK